MTDRPAPEALLDEARTDVSTLAYEAARTIHVRLRELHPRAHPKASGGPCPECMETGRQALSIALLTAEELGYVLSPARAERPLVGESWADRWCICGHRFHQHHSTAGWCGECACIQVRIDRHAALPAGVDLAPAMTTLNVGIHMHEAPAFVDPELGPCVTLDRHYEPPLLGEFDGVAGNLERCVAITEKRLRCPKPGAVALLVNGLWEMVCGGHYGVHRRGVRLLELVARR